MSAIADAECESFDDIKKYLHLERDIEDKLKSFLELVKRSSSKKLFLVCGNVGDGKSHLLASIRINNPGLLADIKLYNDATESSEPGASFIDELNKNLAPYSDVNLATGNEKTVIAINLGTLNNFLTSDEENRFSRLQEYVRDKRILEVGDIEACTFNEDSPFQFVNFCDYNLFYLTKDGPQSELIEKAIERIVSPDGPFFEAYEHQKRNYPRNCPICFNFEALRALHIRKKISSLLIECIVQGEIIISIRALYNFIYEIIIPIDIEPLDHLEAIKCIKQYDEADFLRRIIPNYIFLHPELSNIFEQIQRSDPAIRRGETIDDAIIELVVSDSPLKIINKYLPLDNISEILSDILHKKSSSDEYINAFIRVAFFWPKTDNILVDNQAYEIYMKLMFDWYSGNGKSLKPLYSLVQNAVTAWRGLAGTGKINIDIGRQQLEYRVSEKINIKPEPPSAISSLAEIIHEFNAFLPVRFRVGSRIITLAITYKLFCIIKKIANGYRPTSLDHSNFIVFDEFVQRITGSGEGQNQVFFTESANRRQFVLELDNFGDFCFNEVSG